jgi:hypothetical protein
MLYEVFYQLVVCSRGTCRSEPPVSEYCAPSFQHCSQTGTVIFEVFLHMYERRELC